MQNINSFLKSVVRISNVDRITDSRNYKVYPCSKTDEVLEPVEIKDAGGHYEALRLYGEILKKERFGNQPIFFQMMDKGDAFKVLDQSGVLLEDFLVHVFEDGNIIALEVEINASYGGGVCSSFLVKYGSREATGDGMFGYYSSQTQYFQRTVKGLQEAFNCFMDRVQSKEPHKGSKQWPGMSVQGNRELMKLSNIALSEQVLLQNGYQIITNDTNRQNKVSCYQKKYRDGVGTKYFINIERYDLTEFKMSIEYQWVMEVVMNNNGIGHDITIKIPINARASVLDFVQAEDSVEQIYRQLGCSYHSQF